MKRVTLSAVLLLAGCSRASGPAGEPIDRMFDSHYEKFISSAKAHRGACEIAVSAKGDGGTRNDSVESGIEVDADENFHVSMDGGFDLVRVGSATWQKEKGGKFEAVESGARSDLMRDDAIVGWRDVLRPMQDRITLTRAETSKLGERDVEAYTIAVEAGGGADGGLKVIDGEGGLGLDAKTGFPVHLTFKGSWEAPATPPAEGRVTWTVEKMECAITEIGGIEAITPALATPTAKPATTPEPAASPAATVKPKATPTPVPTTPKNTKSKLKIR